MSIQFATFDTLEDRRELVILFQKLGEGLPDPMARRIRANWLEKLIAKSTSFAKSPVQVNPDTCHPVGAYSLFIQIVGVLGVPITDAAVALDRYVAKGDWR